MAAVQSVNEEHCVESGNKLLVGSLDVKALYPSLNIPFAAEKISEEFIESKLEFDCESVDLFELGLYLVLTVSNEDLVAEGLKDVCPSRRNTRGRKPNITGQASASTEKRSAVWYPPRNSRPDAKTVKRMIGKAIQVGTKAVMTAHAYKFAGDTRVQKQGGAIGLELTGEIAAVFMSWWDKRMRLKIEEEGIKTVMYKRYVDDINLIVEVKDESEEE